jgi:uncharacterized protein (TIGR03437 family)
VEVTGSGVPTGLNKISAVPGSSLDYIYSAISAPLIDVTSAGNDGLACSAISGSLGGAFALIERGSCTFSEKLANAVNAGASGVIFYNDPTETLKSPDVGSASQPTVMISNSDGLALKSFIDSSPGYTATIDPSAVEVALNGAGQLTGYSSRGPALGTSGIKPDLLAVGGGSRSGDLVYMGAEDYDPLGILFSSNRYAAAAGTSFATPITAGAAALVKQMHPGYTSQQIKSVLMNTASLITRDDTNNTVNVVETGAGQIAADAAINSNVTVVPSSISFGSFTSGSAASGSQQLTITNAGAATLALTLAVQASAPASGTTVALSQTSLSIDGSKSATVTATLSGTVPAGGIYYGNINVTGGAVALHVPYMFISPVGTAQPVNLYPVLGDNDDGTLGKPIPDGALAFQLTDANGAPVTNTAVTFTVQPNSIPVTLSQVSTTTDQFGYAFAAVLLGSQEGTYRITGAGGGASYTFTGTASVPPTIGTGGVVNAAAASTTAPIAPGSYISIYGTGLSYFGDTAVNGDATRLPLALDYVNVSFDAPATGSLPAISVPGRLTYVSPLQVNVQVPWELQGYSTGQVKVTIDYRHGNVVTANVADYSPAFFEISSGVAAALDSNFAVISSSNPAKRGQYISVFANGLGPVSNQPASGENALSSPLSETTTQPVVTFGGQTAAVQFSGLAPGFPGLYQINVLVPSNISAGNQPLIVSIGGKTSQTSGITVQ